MTTAPLAIVPPKEEAEKADAKSPMPSPVTKRRGRPAPVKKNPESEQKDSVSKAGAKSPKNPFQSESSSNEDTPRRTRNRSAKDIKVEQPPETPKSPIMPTAQVVLQDLKKVDKFFDKVAKIFD